MVVAFGLPLASGRAYALRVNTLQLQFLISILAGCLITHSTHNI